MSRSGGRANTCGPNEARTRLISARAFVSVAELVYAGPDDPVLPLRGVPAALAHTIQLSVRIVGGIQFRLLDRAPEIA